MENNNANNALIHKNNTNAIELPDRQTAKQELDRIKAYKEAIQSYLIPNVDYGKAFAKQPKPSLFKAGAEKIIDMLKLNTNIELITKIEDYKEGTFAYTIRCILHRGERVIEGIGSCNSKEDKFRKQNAFTIANTILKMASKRAMVDAVLKIGCLSEAFTQDLEDYTSTSRNHNQTNTHNSNYNTKEDKSEKSEKDWTKIHLQKFFTELTRQFSDKELQDKNFKNDLICKLGEVKDWKELNSFRVKKWKEKLYNKDKEFLDRIKGVLFALKNTKKKSKEDKAEQNKNDKDKVLEGIYWAISENSKLSAKVKVCTTLNAFKFYLIHRLTGKRVKELNTQEHIQGLKDIAKRINGNNEQTLNEIEQIAMLWAGENSDEYFEAKEKLERDQEREIISK